MNDFDELEVSARQLAEMIGVSDRRVRQLAEQGVVSRAAKTGRYKLAESIRGFVAETKTASHDEAAQLLIEARRQKLDREKLKSRIKDGELVPIETFNTFSRAMTLAAEKGAASLDRYIIPVVKEVKLLNDAVNDYHRTFFDWLRAAQELALKGGTAQDVETFFATYSTPTDAQEALKRKPRKTENTDDDE